MLAVGLCPSTWLTGIAGCSSFGGVDNKNYFFFFFVFLYFCYCLLLWQKCDHKNCRKTKRGERERETEEYFIILIYVLHEYLLAQLFPRTFTSFSFAKWPAGSELNNFPLQKWQRKKKQKWKPYPHLKALCWHNSH